MDNFIRKGRGALINEVGRYEPEQREAFHDEWDIEEDLPPLATTLTRDATRTIIARNDSPDIPFDRSINPYRGCEHGCIYCYARPTHAYLGLSPGLDFESRLLFKPDAPELLARELSARSYKPQPIALGTNTDPYQPVERTQHLTRRILEVLRDFNHPLTIVTKSALVTRDIDILAPMAALNLARVGISITTLDPALARSMEPRASSPARRLDAIRQLSAAGIPTMVMTAPMIPALNDHELESILERAAAAGATRAGMTVIRLPLEIKQLFEDWLAGHAPGRAAHVMSLIRQCHGGKAYRSDWGVRKTGDGPYAELIGMRFTKACKRLGLDGLRTDLDISRFAVPPQAGQQMRLL